MRKLIYNQQSFTDRAVVGNLSSYMTWQPDIYCISTIPHSLIYNSWNLSTLNFPKINNKNNYGFSYDIKTPNNRGRNMNYNTVKETTRKYVPLTLRKKVK